MKANKILALLSLFLIMLSGCKKDDVKSTSDTVTVGADGSINISDADGALYAIQSKNFDTHNGSTFETNQIAYAWFGKFPSLIDAGIVKVNTIELDNFGNYYNAFAPLPFTDSLFKDNNVTAVWNVEGNTTSGVPAFTHTDNSPLPAAPNFTLPVSVNINNSLTVNNSTTGGEMGVLYTLIGDNGDTTKYVPKTSSSITFSSAEIKSVAVSRGRLGLSIMPVTYSSATYGGKKYYFVKQHQYTRETVTQ